MPSLACYAYFWGCFLDLSFGIGYIRCFNQMANIFLNCIQIPPSAFDFSIYFNTVINIFMIEGYSLQLDESYEKMEWQKPKKRPIQSPASRSYICSTYIALARPATLQMFQSNGQHIHNLYQNPQPSAKHQSSGQLIIEL